MMAMLMLGHTEHKHRYFFRYLNPDRVLVNYGTGFSDRYFSDRNQSVITWASSS